MRHDHDPAHARQVDKDAGALVGFWRWCAGIVIVIVLLVLLAYGCARRL